MNLKKMRKENKIDLLNSEGPIVIAEWRGEDLYVHHREYKKEKKIYPSELIEIMQGKMTVTLGDNVTIDMSHYPEDMKPTGRALDRFLSDPRVKPLVYIANPYSHSDPSIVQKRYDKICQVTAGLVSKGQMAISPIAYGHTLLGYCEMPGDWEFWQSFCISLLARCQKMIVVKMEGWQESRGVLAEIEYAKSNGIEIEYLDL